MKLFKSKLRRRVETLIDVYQHELSGLEAKKGHLKLYEQAQVWSRQKDLIDHIRLLKSIL